jgi:hypothetical protein
MVDERFARHLLEGWVWTSTDLLFALMATWVAWGVFDQLVTPGVLGFVLAGVFGLAVCAQGLVRLLFRRLPRLARAWAKLRGLTHNLSILWTATAFAGLFVLFGLVYAVFGQKAMDYLFWALFTTACTGVTMLAVWLTWRLTAAFEDLATARLWRWCRHVRWLLLEEAMERGDMLRPRMDLHAHLKAAGGTLKFWRKDRGRKGRFRLSWWHFVVVIWGLVSLARVLQHVAR